MKSFYPLVCILLHQPLQPAPYWSESLSFTWVLRVYNILTKPSALLSTHTYTCTCPNADTYVRCVCKGRCSKFSHSLLPVTGREEFQTISKREKEMYIWNMVYDIKGRSQEWERLLWAQESWSREFQEVLKSSFGCVRPNIFRIPNKVLWLLMSMLMTLQFTQ